MNSSEQQHDSNSSLDDVAPYKDGVSESPPFNVTARVKGNDRTDFDAFLYIIIVLSFYAISIVLLMIKYIRREEEELSLDYYYTEFVKRDRFNTPIYKNRLALGQNRQLLENAQRLFRKSDSKKTKPTETEIVQVDNEWEETRV